jgi:hypothetical protein
MKPGNFILDIRPSQLHEVFKRPLGFRSIGSRPQETTQFADIYLQSHFDIIVFTTKSAHTTSLPE